MKQPDEQQAADALAGEPDVLQPAPAPWRLRVIGRESLDEVLGLALERTLKRHIRGGNGERVERLKTELRAEFQRLFKQHGKEKRCTSRSRFLLDLERSRNSILAARDKLREELSELTGKLELLEVIEQRAQAPPDEHRDEVGPDRSEAIRQLLAKHERQELKSAEVQEMMENLLHNALVETRLAAQEEHTAHLNESTSNLRRRIAKLRHTLETSEAELIELARRKDVTPGIASFYRTVQGLCESTLDRRVKEALLERIYLANLDLRGCADPAT